MPTTEEPERQRAARPDDARLTHDPMTSLEAERAREEALRRAGERWSDAVIGGGHGRVEQETRLLTERLTHEAQERRRAANPPAARGAPQRFAVRREEGRRLPVGEAINHILLALDGSLFAERALPYAEALARMTGADITVGASTDRADLARHAGSDPTHATGDTLVSALMRARARAGVAGLRAHARIVYNPNPASGILALQNELGATVIALASHVRHGVDRALAGSMVDEALRANWAYTLIIPSGADDFLDKQCAFRRILTPLDGSKTAESTLAPLALLLTQPAPEARPRRVTLLFVAASHTQEADGAAYLHEIQAAVERECGALGIVFTKVAVGTPSVVIIEEASGAHAAIPSVARYDLTLLAAHAESPAARWTLGGVPTYALTHGDSPILFVRAPRET